MPELESKRAGGASPQRGETVGLALVASVGP